MAFLIFDNYNFFAEVVFFFALSLMKVVDFRKSYIMID